MPKLSYICRCHCQSDLTPDDLYTTYLAFLDEAHRLKTLYAPRINLLVGIESEYITDLDLQGIQRLLEEQGDRIQYVVGSVHHVNSIPVDFDVPTFDSALIECGATRESPSKFLEAYLDDQYKMLSTLQPAVVGHFDLCRLFASEIRLDADPAVWEKVVRNVEHVIGYGGMFEVNAASFRKGWNQAYPGREVLQVSPASGDTSKTLTWLNDNLLPQLIIAKSGRLCLSDDSHGPKAVGLNYLRMRDYLLDSGVEEIWYLTDRKEGQVGLGKTRAKRYEGDWASDEFWNKVAL